MVIETIVLSFALAFGIGEVLDEIEPTASVDLRAESRVRPAGHTDPEAFAAGEIEIMAGALAGMRLGPVAFAVRYAPSVTFTSHDALTDPLVLQQGMARAYVELGGSFRLVAAHLRQYGDRNFTAAIAHEEADGRRIRLEFLPDMERLPISAHHSTFGVTWTPARYREYRLLGGYASFGGRSEWARERLPKQSGPRLSLQGDFGLSGRNAIVGELRGERTDLEPGPTFLIGEIEGGWRHHWDRRTELLGAVGLFGGYNEEPIGSELRSVLLPTLRGEMVRVVRRGRPEIEIEAVLYGRPMINQLQATLDPRVGIEAAAEWEMSQSISGRVDLGQALVFDESFGLEGQLMAMSGNLAVPLTSMLQVEGGLRVFRQKVRYGVGWWGPAGWRWDLFFALSFDSSLSGQR